MASNILYPPTVDSTAPAFIATESSACRIYFSLSKFNTSSDFECAHVAIFKQDSGLNVVNKQLNNDRYRASGIIINVPVIKVEGYDNKYYIEIINNDVINGWQAGWVYKVQLRLSAVTYDESIGQSTWLNTFANQFSEWSTACITKATDIISFQIPNYNYNGSEVTFETTVDNLDFTGIYINNDTSEPLYSYRVQLYDNNSNLLEDSDILYANQYADINQFNYSFKTEPINNNIYTVKIAYETLNQYTNIIEFICNVSYTEESSINIYLLTAENDTDNIMNSVTSVFAEEEEGRVGIKLYSESSAETVDIMIRRADSRNNFQTWTDIKFISFTNEDVNLYPIVYDYTIESGVWYQYGIQKYNKTEDSISRGPLNIITQPVMRNFNYSFLLGENEQQLKLQFNNVLSNYKVNLSENKFTTLGYNYPFIVRNGATNYITFSINGLISFNMDENELFLTKEDIYKFENIIELYSQYNKNNNISQYDYIYEKDFRNKVINFLHNGKVKLFKSPTEGNILIRMTDINLAPQQSLSRLIYDFSATANEIAENSMENYKKYNLYSL